MYAWVLFTATSSSRAEDPVLSASVLTETQHRCRAVSEELTLGAATRTSDRQSRVSGLLSASCLLRQRPTAPMDQMPLLLHAKAFLYPQYQPYQRLVRLPQAGTSSLAPSHTMVWQTPVKSHGLTL